jgi:hypothetical protein
MKRRFGGFRVGGFKGLGLVGWWVGGFRAGGFKGLRV